MDKIDNQGISALSNVDLNRIKQPAVQKLISRHISEGMDDFDDIVSTYKQGDDLSKYLIHTETYHYPLERDKVFEKYISQNPSEAWNGKLLSFGMLVSKSTKSVLFPGGKYEGAQTGQVLYLNLNMLMGMIKLAVAHEIIGVNRKEKYMDLSYVVGADSVGVQHIKFVDDGDGSTTVEHITYYTGDSMFRAKYIYPYFHTKVINDYHNNMKLALEDKL